MAAQNNPSLSDSVKALYDAGGKSWDDVADPEALLAEIRGKPGVCHECGGNGTVVDRVNGGWIPCQCQEQPAQVATSKADACLVLSIGEAQLLYEGLRHEIERLRRLPSAMRLTPGEESQVVSERHSLEKIMERLGKAANGESPAVPADALRAVEDERDALRGEIEGAHDPKSVGNIAWLAEQYLKRAHKAEAELAVVKAKLSVRDDH